MLEPVAVIGGGGHAKVVIATLEAAGREIAGVWDDNPERFGSTVLGYPVLGTTADLTAGARRPAVVAIGDNRVRQRIARRLDLEWVVAVHPAAVVHRSVRLGPGTVVFAGAIVQPSSELGEHVIVNTGARVDHDCRIGGFVHVCPGVSLAGAVRLDEGVMAGIGSCVIQERRVGPWAVVGAGAVVVRDVPGGLTVTGVPARARVRPVPAVETPVAPVTLRRTARARDDWASGPGRPRRVREREHGG